MIRTTVMLSQETHERLRRLARRRGVPLARVIRDALTHVAQTDGNPPISFIGAVSVPGANAQETADLLPPLSPFRTDAPSDDDIERYRQLAKRRTSEREPGC